MAELNMTVKIRLTPKKMRKIYEVFSARLKRDEAELAASHAAEIVEQLIKMGSALDGICGTYWASAGVTTHAQTKWRRLVDELKGN